MDTTLTRTEAYNLAACITSTPNGYDLRFVSHVPSARRPEEQVRFQTMLDRDALVALRTLIDEVLA